LFERKYILGFKTGLNVAVSSPPWQKAAPLPAVAPKKSIVVKKWHP
jgi:hypothetical protein